MHQNDRQTFFEEIPSDRYLEELPEYFEPDSVGLSEEGVKKLQDDIMNPLPPSDQA